MSKEQDLMYISALISSLPIKPLSMGTKKDLNTTTNWYEWSVESKQQENASQSPNCDNTSEQIPTKDWDYTDVLLNLHRQDIL